MLTLNFKLFLCNKEDMDLMGLNSNGIVKYLIISET